MPCSQWEHNAILGASHWSATFNRKSLKGRAVHTSRQKLVHSAVNTKTHPKMDGLASLLSLVPMHTPSRPFISYNLNQSLTNTIKTDGRTTSPGDSLPVHGLRGCATKQRRGRPLEAPPPAEQRAGGGTSARRHRPFRWRRRRSRQQRQDTQLERTGPCRCRRCAAATLV